MARCRSCNERDDHDAQRLAIRDGRCRACWWEKRAGEIELERNDVARKLWALECRLRPLKEAIAAITSDPPDDPEIQRRSQYEATLRGLALSPCSCTAPHPGGGMSCLSCGACRILSRADARVNDNVPL